LETLTDPILKPPSVKQTFGLPIIWYASPSGNDSVNTIDTINWIYAGSKGSVYRIAKNNGLIQATQGLSGYGNHAVSLATPSNGAALVVGIYRFVLRLHPVSLDIIWYFRTENLEGDVSVILDAKNQRIYAGTAGGVFALDLDGNKMGRQTVIAGESRIALDPSASFVGHGISGCVAVYTTPNLDSTLWITKMDKGVGPTSVLFNETTMYVADSGFIWVMDVLHGGLPLHTTDVGATTGYREIRLALDATNNRLYVGTHGYGGLYDATTLAQKYLQPLPGSGYSVTNVVWLGNSGFFANNGRVFQLNNSGVVVARNDLDGYKNVDTSLTILGNDKVIAGPDGWVVGLLLLEAA
jgi:hypothetical protein